MGPVEAGSRLNVKWGSVGEEQVGFEGGVGR